MSLLTSHLNGGKWSQEEEIFAESLMDAFRAGLLADDDIDEGTSLRKYLSKKLLCSPKRVSKKYEGTNYNGKQVYIKKFDETSNSAIAKETQGKLKILERKFRAALEEMQKNGSPTGVKSLKTDVLLASTEPSYSPATSSYISQLGAARNLGLGSDLWPSVQNRAALLGGNGYELSAMQRYQMGMDNMMVNRQLSSLYNPGMLGGLPSSAAAGMYSMGAMSGNPSLYGRNNFHGDPLLEAAHLTSLQQKQQAGAGPLHGRSSLSPPTESDNKHVMDSILASENRMKRYRESMVGGNKRARCDP